MESKYDIEQWATETTLGRRVYNHNYRMIGNELRGWELVNSIVMQKESGITEKVYVWQKNGSEGEKLIRISIAELTDWINAQNQLRNELRHSMRPDIPRGTGKIAETGDVNFIGKERKSKTIAQLLFTRGNLAVSLASVGKKTVDISKFAKLLDTLFSQPPETSEVETGLVKEVGPETLQAKEAETLSVIEKIDELIAHGEWLKVIAPDGELKLQDNALVYESKKAGRKRIGRYVTPR